MNNNFKIEPFVPIDPSEPKFIFKAVAINLKLLKKN